MNRTFVTVLVTAALLVLAFFGGHQSGLAKERAHWLDLRNSDLREQNREITRQIQVVAEKQKVYNHAKDQIADFTVRLRGADRLRIKAEHQAAVERASADSVRAYARGVHGLFDECRTAYGELAAQGAGAAAAASALKPAQ